MIVAAEVCDLDLIIIDIILCLAIQDSTIPTGLDIIRFKNRGSPSVEDLHAKGFHALGQWLESVVVDNHLLVTSCYPAERDGVVVGKMKRVEEAIDLEQESY